MAEELDKNTVDKRRLDRDDEAATDADVEAHKASVDRRYLRDEDREAEADEGQERRR
jgi:hypothetical protein